MKRYYPFLLIILSLLISCGGDGGGVSSSKGEKSFVKITLGGSEKPFISFNQGSGFRGSSIPPEISKISFTISASDMTTVNKDVLIAGQSSITETFSIQNGDDRHFLCEAKNSSGTVLYKGESTADLDGTPVTLEDRK